MFLSVMDLMTMIAFSFTLEFSKAKLLPADLIVNHFFHSEHKYADKNFSYVAHKAD